jgi:hypothetical protein
MSDVTLVPSMWVGKDGHLTPDFARMHMCGNHDAVRQYIAREGVRPPRPGQIKPKDGDYILDDYV